MAELKQINWSSTTGDKFQDFCNALLSFEVSKRFIPFGAAGRDQGNDGIYIGLYDGLAGKWRFQHKFHAEEKAASRVKNDMEKEVGNIEDEDHFILLTNVKLGPAQREKVLNAGGDVMRELHKKPARIDVWDGAKLFNLYLRFPILKFWLEEGFYTFQLVKYDVAFAAALNNDVDSIYTLNNLFISRVKELNVLRSFLDDPGKSVVMVTGEAGVGKTRLVIEFFKQEIDLRDDWDVFALRVHGINYDKLAFALESPRNILLLVDDAHQYDPRVIADLKKLAGDMNGRKVKIILTARSVGTYEAFKYLSAQDKQHILDVPLDKLDPEDTTALFKRYFGEDHFYKHYLGQLVDISRGRPILIVALIRTIRQGKPVNQSKQEDFFFEYVIRYFDGLIEKMNGETAIPRDKLRRLLRLICLLEPIRFNDPAVHKLIAEKEGVELDSMRLIFSWLMEGGFASGYFDQAIKPDYYSDILLAQANEEWVRDKVALYTGFISHIIVNLSVADEAGTVQPTKSGVLDEILASYLDRMDSVKDWSELKAIADTVYEVAYSKPDVAVGFITKFVRQLVQKGTVAEKEFSYYGEHYLKQPYTGYDTVRHILSTLLYRKERFGFVFDSVLSIYQHNRDSQLFKVTFGLATRDRLDNYLLARQNYFVERVKRMVEGADNSLGLFFVACMEALLILEFRGTLSDSFDGRASSIIIYWVPSSEEVRQMRASAISVLKALYFKGRGSELGLAALKALLDLPQKIQERKHNERPYDSDAEIQEVMDFLLSVKFSGEEKHQALAHLKRFKRWGFNGSLQKQLDLVEKSLRQDKTAKRISDLLDNAEDAAEINLAREDLRKKARDIVKDSTGMELAKAIDAVVPGDGYISYWFGEFLKEVIAENPVKAKAIYRYLYARRVDVIYKFGSTILRELRFGHHADHFFWSKMLLLKQEQKADADRVMLHVYAFLDKEIVQLGKKDLTFFRELFARRSKMTDDWLGIALLTVVKVDKGMFDELVPVYLNDCSEAGGEFFFSHFFEMGEAYFDVACSVLLHHSYRLPISFKISYCLAKVIEKRGIDPVFGYMVRRFEFFMEPEGELGFRPGGELVPTATGQGLSSRIRSEDDKISLYLACLDWYLQVPLSEAGQLFAPRMLEYVQVSGELTAELDIAYRARIDGAKGDSDRMLRVMKGLELFEKKNERLIDLVMYIFTLSAAYFSDPPELLSKMNYYCGRVVLSLGGKMGRPGEPFPEDLALRELLSNVRKKYEDDSGMARHFKNLIMEVERAIDRQIGPEQKGW